ncbi:Hydrolase [Caenispirillum salinarum AK4]|uniref:Hydrolase n=1 Tax=Caenispirillum salinarum AK4 TaxID=1238182 RepID=K9GNE6_9PROT|nr:alpha/beta fold hydrolase [Caenispirillum salinarum]EKV26602.1 Hydrolase [Caenispirillum salinarum AK4]
MELAYTEYGEAGAPPMVIAHGLYGQRKNWTTIAKGLADDLHVFTVDLRNHGDSPWDASMDYRDMAADLREFMAARGILGEAILVGHSMGGKAAMTLALTDSDAIAGLVSADMPPARLKADTVRYAAIMKAVDLDACERRGDVDKALAADVPEQMVRLFLLQSLESTKNGFRWKLNLDAITEQWDRIADFPVTDRTYDGPALFLSGGASPYVQPEHEDIIARMFPNALEKRVPGAGHWLHAEKPDDVVQALLEFAGV